MTATIQLSLQANVATITLNRPEKLNSFTRQMHAELRDALDAAQAQGARAIVLTGAGRGFCAGQDLADLDFTPGASTDLGALIDENFNPLVRKLRAMPVPVIAAVNGIAAGAGANLALACDIVLAGASVNFVQAFVKIGLLPDTGGTWFLPRILGVEKAKLFAFTGELWDGATAKANNLVTEVVPTDRLFEATLEFAKRLASGPTIAIGLAKMLIDSSHSRSLAEQQIAEQAAGRLCAPTKDHAEGLAAANERREPRFIGA